MQIMILMTPDRIENISIKFTNEFMIDIHFLFFASLSHKYFDNLLLIALFLPYPMF